MMAEDEPMVRAYVGKLTKKLIPDFESTLTTPEERASAALSATFPRALDVDGIRDLIRCQQKALNYPNILNFTLILNSRGEWPRKNDGLSAKNREEGNAAFQVVICTFRNTT